MAPLSPIHQLRRWPDCLSITPLPDSSGSLHVVVASVSEGWRSILPLQLDVLAQDMVNNLLTSTDQYYVGNQIINVLDIRSVQQLRDMLLCSSRTTSLIDRD